MTRFGDVISPKYVGPTSPESDVACIAQFARILGQQALCIFLISTLHRRAIFLLRVAMILMLGNGLSRMPSCIRMPS